MERARKFIKTAIGNGLSPSAMPGMVTEDSAAESNGSGTNSPMA